MKRLVIVSGYFNPIHAGHVRLLEAAKQLGDRLLVIVNNDRQQMEKKGKIIMDECERMYVVRSIRYVDEVVLAVDDGPFVAKTLKQIAVQHPEYEIVLGNGGEAELEMDSPEGDVCRRHGIRIKNGLGGDGKLNCSSRINRLRGAEAASETGERG